MSRMHAPKNGYALATISILTIIVGTQLTAVESVIGGTVAHIQKFPYQVSLHKNGHPRCGGAIINANHVLTAAHCVFPASSNVSFPAEWLSIRAGSNNLHESGVIVNVAEVKIHPRYNYPQFDLALLKLAKPLQFTNFIRSIPIRRQHVRPGRLLTVSGWGATSTGSSSVPILRQIRLKAVHNSICYRNVQYNPTSFCMSSSVGRGICQGDSGSPAVFDGRLVGIVGFTRGSCGTAHFDGFTKVAFLQHWILQNSVL